jgi:hypothetical protein
MVQETIQCINFILEYILHFRFFSVLFSKLLENLNDDQFKVACLIMSKIKEWVELKNKPVHKKTIQASEDINNGICRDRKDYTYPYNCLLCQKDIQEQ